MAASARPRFDEDGEVLFDGKIGIFPFIFTEPAQRNSRNRPRGTLVTKPVPIVNKDVYRSFLINKVILAIKEKWPTGSNKRVIIQQDNAKPHIACNDPAFLQVAQADGFDISLTFQPPNSPDLNVLDLGYFRAIQSLQQDHKCKTIDDLVHVVTKSYNEFEPMRSNFVWLSLQYCM
ncbi:unnamed protein product [Cuscuta campestris]|uniref:Tc1-like transposase DDE domain-containing protein n=1 Tax=Cuscuta campestris TaxID=132261 RepID=A0A484N2F7_9ASTE|nr:unnamed protein product [Cuscuta campestris]